MTLYKSHLVDDFVQDECIEASFTWSFLIFGCAVLRLKHPTKVGPEMTIRCCQNHPHWGKNVIRWITVNLTRAKKNFHRLKHPIKVGPVLTTMHCNANHQMLPKSPKQWELFFFVSKHLAKVGPVLTTKLIFRCSRNHSHWRRNIIGRWMLCIWQHPKNCHRNPCWIFALFCNHTNAYILNPHP